MEKTISEINFNKNATRDKDSHININKIAVAISNEDNCYDIECINNVKLELKNKKLNYDKNAHENKHDLLCRYFTIAGVNQPTSLTEKILSHYKTLTEFFQSSPEQVAHMFDLPSKVTKKIQIIKDLVHMAAQEKIIETDLLSSWNELNEYLNIHLNGAMKEQTRLLLLNKKNYLLADIVLWEGTIDHAPCYPREIVKLALDYRASAIILVHNHPSGDPSPSKADIVMTHNIIELLGIMSVTLHDHIIVGRENSFSMRKNNLLEL